MRLRVLRLLFCQEFLYLNIFILYEQLPYMKAAITKTHFWYNIQDEEWKLNQPWVSLFMIASVFLSFCRSCFTSFCLASLLSVLLSVCPFYVLLSVCPLVCRSIFPFLVLSISFIFQSFCLYILLYVPLPVCSSVRLSFCNVED